MTSYFIPQRFKKVIALHVAKNLFPNDFPGVPLILGIHGPSGEGKTFQAEAVLREMKVGRFLISGGQMESHRAGDPAKLIRETYINASRAIDEGSCGAAVLLINDIDAGVGDWGGMVQYTTNRQGVFGELMHLVDYPHIVAGEPVRRIPIILTGNDFNKLYEPLVRAGRMSSFEWTFLEEERIQVVHRIFPELSFDSVATLVRELEGREQKLPISFYTHLRTTLLDEYLWLQIEGTGLGESMDRMMRGERPRLRWEIEIRTLAAAGIDLLSSGQLLNHLRRS